MALLGFKEQFVPHIQSGRKQHTIRADRKIPIRIGETLYHYGKVRQKGMYRIIPPVPCTDVQPIKITFWEPLRKGAVKIHTVVKIGDDTLSHLEQDELAYADGFDDFAQMWSFFEGRLPFGGQIVHWRFSDIPKGQL